MIELKPRLNIPCACPECGSGSAVNRSAISGMNAYADCTCGSCGLSFFRMLPASHYVNAEVAVEKTHFRIYNDNAEFGWLSPIVKDSFPLQEDHVVIRKKVFMTSRNVVILNALDFLYGHSVLKLYNAQYHLDNNKDVGLVIMVPGIFEWMIPQGCAEAWIVDLGLNDLRKGYHAIQQFVEGELKRFDKVYLSRAYSHPDFVNVDISRFTGIKPFDISDFDARKPCITFILREDRWWLSRPVDYWFYRFCRKFGLLKRGNKILASRQNGLVKRTIRVIRKAYPAADFFIAGLGNTGSFHGIANDRRVLVPTDDSEKEWCSIYGQSHLVIGFHGSNMLLPTAFAAGCIEILPEDRYGNMVQDISVRYADRRQLFLYRFTSQYSKPKAVAKQAISILRDYKTFALNMCANVYR